MIRLIINEILKHDVLHTQRLTVINPFSFNVVLPINLSLEETSPSLLFLT
jgi:hypothetical protein